MTKTDTIGMGSDVFSTADILLPHNISMEKWSVIACDQFSSEREYWERVRTFAGDEPSTLNMIIPEAFLFDADGDASAGIISETMEKYNADGLFRVVEDSFIYIVRTLPDGRERCGLVGAVDLEQYSFSGGAAPILASEGTVLERLPARISIRRAARFELPHIMSFISDPNKTVIEPLAQIAGDLPLLYDFDLMEGGGHIKGMRVFGEAAENVAAALHALQADGGILLVVGDGNHSLAAAKVYWDEIKRGMSPDERAAHPARKALVEINNVFDPAIDFEAIHRVVFNVDRADFIHALAEAMPGGSDYGLRWVSGGESGIVGVAAGCIGDMLDGLVDFMDNYARAKSCDIDYIHGAESVEHLARSEGCVGLILPSMDKSELFRTVANGGVFPKKSFSVGHAKDKRYYLECREIV
ncbi:MAG: DUF1015 domain-containing protein [Oscillospiraceae bacterium]|nr:DUF1015 domain-containing protein [Oscillospiraceae bacterium]